MIQNSGFFFRQTLYTRSVTYRKLILNHDELTIGLEDIPITSHVVQAIDREVHVLTAIAA